MKNIVWCYYFKTPLTLLKCVVSVTSFYCSRWCQSLPDLPDDWLLPSRSGNSQREITDWESDVTYGDALICLNLLLCKNQYINKDKRWAAQNWASDEEFGGAP